MTNFWKKFLAALTVSVCSGCMGDGGEVARSDAIEPAVSSNETGVGVDDGHPQAGTPPLTPDDDAPKDTANGGPETDTGNQEPASPAIDATTAQPMATSGRPFTQIAPADPAAAAHAANDADVAASPERQAEVLAHAAPPLNESRHIVIFNETVANPEAESAFLIRDITGSKRNFVYQHALKGSAVSLPDAATAQFLETAKKHPAVLGVYPDREVAIVDFVGSSAGMSGSGMSWGLDRIDQRRLPLDRNCTYGTAGEGVDVFALGTGIDAGHREFASRVATGYSAIQDDHGTADRHGNGTHVAGIIAGNSYGVARAATLVPVRVLDDKGRGTISTVLAGIDWVAAHAQGPSVLNLTLSTNGTDVPLKQALQGATARGITVVAAAGDGDEDACKGSSAGAPPASIVVGATNSSDQRARRSNWGSCVSVFAPGEEITSAAPGNGMAVRSGTSMAAAHVAGATARLLSRKPAMSPVETNLWISLAATKDKVADVGKGSPNRLLFIGNEVVSLKSLSGTSGWTKNAYQWQGNVTIAAQNSEGQPVAGVRASGRFAGLPQSFACVTDARGYCKISSDPIDVRWIRKTKFVLESLTGEGAQHQPHPDARSPQVALSVNPGEISTLATLRELAVPIVSLPQQGWRANVEITLTDDKWGKPIPYAYVRGRFSHGGSERLCRTDVNGRCEILSDAALESMGSTMFSITGIGNVPFKYVPRNGADSYPFLNPRPR